ncbi:MAG: hypothetical protein WC878_02660 [Candidatus Paceibacterota bacterium]|jgi:hypothetical protein
MTRKSKNEVSIPTIVKVAGVFVGVTLVFGLGAFTGVLFQVSSAVTYAMLGVAIISFIGFVIVAVVGMEKEI